MNLVDSFKKYISSHHLFTLKDHLLIAVSGGVDSVVLCELCCQSGYRFSIAHCNFQLRGEESEGDESFVKALAEKYAVSFFIKKFDTQAFAAASKLSIQVAARELRYKWFSELVSQSATQPNYLLTAHHADDNIETITMNFFKGTGINGLKGILAKQHHIVRPLLFAAKEQLLAFAREQQLSFREDSSNSSNKYTRNYFRNELLPAVEKVFPEVKANLLHNAERFREINSIYNTAIQTIKSKLVFQQGAAYHIPVLKLQQTEAKHTVLYEIIKEYGFTAAQVEEVMRLLQSESGKFIHSASHRILRNRKWLVISALDNSEETIHVIDENTSAVFYKGGQLSIRLSGEPLPVNKSALMAQLDARRLQFPLLLRRWKAGDYFYPLGMAKKKKISRLLTDLKLSLNEKQQVWVLESDKKIVWVAGHRIDDRFKITPSTTSVVLLEILPS